MVTIFFEQLSSNNIYYLYLNGASEGILTIILISDCGGLHVDSSVKVSFVK